jgi:hypothetical protein
MPMHSASKPALSLLLQVFLFTVPSQRQAVHVHRPLVHPGFEVTDGWTAPPALGEHNDEVLKDWLGA